MSSDYSLSSSRKNTSRSGGGAEGDENDEEFERFLNELTESEMSKKLPTATVQSKPWWMDEEDDEKDKNKKSFLKPKTAPNTAPPPKIDTNLDEQDDQDQIPRLSLDNSTLSTNRDVDVRPRKSWDIKEEDEYEEDFSEQGSSSRNKSARSVIERKSTNKDDEDEDEEVFSNKDKNDDLAGPGSTNLLSKVAFMDSLETANQTLLQQAIKPNTAQNNEPKNRLQSTSGGGKSSPPQTSPRRSVSTLPAQTTQNEEEEDDEQRHQEQRGATNQQIDHMATQTRNDLQDLQRVYQNLATTNDSGLNTLIKAGTSASSENNKSNSNPVYYDLMSSIGGRNVPARSRSAAKSRSSTTNDDYEYDSKFGRLIQAVTDEIETEMAQEVLKDMEKKTASTSNLRQPGPSKAQQIKKSDLMVKGKPSTSSTTTVVKKKKPESENRREEKVREWPPKRFENTKGTGYGTTWVPPTVKRQSIADTMPRSSSARSLNRSSLSRSNLNLNQSMESSYVTKAAKADNQDVSHLKDQLIRCVEENEEKLNEVRKQHERQVNELRSKITELTTQVNLTKTEQKYLSDSKKQLYTKLKEKSEITFGSAPKKEKPKTSEESEVERRLKEQEQLLSAYQIENEKLYADLKEARERTVREVKKLEEEKKGLKVNLIQGKLEAGTMTSIDHSNSMSPNRATVSATEFVLLKKDNAEMRQRLEYYEKHQHQIEDDVKEIEARREEIKRLKEKLKALESGKTAPEYIRELKRVRTQLKEMELLVKRLKKNADPNSGANLSLDYYEKRIESLESQLKEKTLDLDRYKRMWEEKYALLNNGGDVSEIETRLLEMEKGFKQRIAYLEASNSDLKDAKLKLEVRLAEKQKELVDVKHDFDMFVKRDVLNETRMKSYRPELFVDEKINPSSSSSVDFDYVKKLLQENERVKIKLVNAENELRLKAREHEFEMEKLRNSWTQRLSETNRKHKSEVDKLLNLLTGGKSLESSEFQTNFDDVDDDESIFDDPIRSRLLKRANERFMSTQSEAKLARLIDVNHQLNAELMSLRDRCAYLEEFNGTFTNNTATNSNDSLKLKNVVSYYEEQLKNKNKEIDRFRAELDVMLKVLKSLEIK